MKPAEAQKNILEKWPMIETAEVLDDIIEVEVIGARCGIVKCTRKIANFSVEHFYPATEVPANIISRPGVTNIFFNQTLDENSLKYSKSTETVRQKNYQTTVNERGLEFVYIAEVEKLLREQKILKSDSDKIKDYPNKIALISLPKESIIIALADTGQDASGRTNPNRTVIIFHTENNKKLLEFLSKHKQLGLNAIFSLLLSKELTPEFPIDDQRSHAFYAIENNIVEPFITEAQLKKFEINKQDGTLLGRVKRLRPIEE